MESDRFVTVLKWLVLALTATMIVGIVILIGLIFTRFPQPIATLPDAIALPDGAQVSAVTQGRGFLAVVTDAGEILIYSPDGMDLRQRIAVD